MECDELFHVLRIAKLSPYPMPKKADELGPPVSKQHVSMSHWWPYFRPIFQATYAKALGIHIASACCRGIWGGLCQTAAWCPPHFFDPSRTNTKRNHHQPGCSLDPGTQHLQAYDLFGGALCVRRAWEHISTAALEMWGVSTCVGFGFNDAQWHFKEI